MDEFIEKYTRCCSDFLEFYWVSFEKTSTDSEENLLLILYYSIERRKNEMNSGCDLTQFIATPGHLKVHRIFYEHKVGMEGGECLAVV